MSTSKQWLQRALLIIDTVFVDWHLKLNTEKTEWIHLTHDSDVWKSSKQLGSLLGGGADCERRIQLASKVFGRMYSLWIRQEKISENRRIKLYRAFVKPCLTYNCATWGMTKALASEIDRCHRRQLKSLIGIRFPNRISNIGLYQRCREEPLSATIEKARMRMLGHAL